MSTLKRIELPEFGPESYIEIRRTPNDTHEDEVEVRGFINAEGLGYPNGCEFRELYGVPATDEDNVVAPW